MKNVGYIGSAVMAGIVLAFSTACDTYEDTSDAEESPDASMQLSEMSVKSSASALAAPSGPNENYRSQFYQDLWDEHSSWCRLDYPVLWNWNLPNHTCLNMLLERFEEQYPQFVEARPIGETVNKRTLYAVRIGTSDLKDINGQMQPKPVVLMDAAVHGFERPGAIILLDWMDFILNPSNRDRLAYPSIPVDPYHHYFNGEATLGDILKNYVIWLVPIVNADGYDRKSRNNAAGVNLNREGAYSFSSFPREKPSQGMTMDQASTQRMR